MPVRYHAQRQHIIRSLDQILYQLHTISFFLSPALLPFLARVIFQFQFAKPRELDPERSLRFWFFLVVVFNVASVWTHATETPAQMAERSIMLDFVGPGATPTRLHMLLLDFAIIILDMLLVSIAYEHALYEAGAKDAPDPLLPIPPTPSTVPPSPALDFATSPASSTAHLPREYRYPPKPPSLADQQAQYVMDLRLYTIYRRLRDPKPPAPERQRDELLPLPNTTAFQLTGTLRMLIRARARVQRERQVEEERRRQELERRRRRAAESEPRDGEDSEEPARTVPGGLEVEGGS